MWALLRNGAMSDFSLGMALALMCALPFALAWWIVPAIPLARERFETYAMLTVSGPAAVLLLCPVLALIGGETGAVIGFAAGWAIGGLINALWAVRYARLPEARSGPEHGVREAGGFGARAWVNDLFQLINLRPDLFILSAYYGTADTGVYAVTVSITSLVWIVSQPLASVVLPRNAMVFASSDPGLSPVIPEEKQGAAVRHSVLVSAAAAILVIPILALAPLVWGPDFDRTLGLGLILLPGVAMLGVGRVMVAAFTGKGAANEALFVGLVSFPLTFVAFLLVIPDHGTTGAAIVSCCSYIASSALAAYLFLQDARQLRALDARSPVRGPPRLRPIGPAGTRRVGPEEILGQSVASPEMHANGADGNGGGKTEAPVIIEARDVQKSFRIPVHRIDSFKERVVHPFARPDYRVLEALRKVSFDVRRGEFFGIVGRNGSGKSTLLKILASIYRADGGSIRMAGMPAPFIELGVGFNLELSARENVVLNGVMMGLSQREARQRLDSVLDFAELEEFVDLKLKNYSSGMLVRLAFSVMIEAEADILLIDEVLAVGDAAFRQKCRDVFRQMRDSDRTVVLVTHDMTAVQSYCHRAMLLDEGEIRHIGDPEETGRQYMRMNFAKRRISIRGEQRKWRWCPTCSPASRMPGSRTRMADGSRTLRWASRSG